MGTKSSSRTRLTAFSSPSTTSLLIQKSLGLTPSCTAIRCLHLSSIDTLTASLFFRLSLPLQPISTRFWPRMAQSITLPQFDVSSLCRVGNCPSVVVWLRVTKIQSTGSSYFPWSYDPAPEVANKNDARMMQMDAKARIPVVMEQWSLLMLKGVTIFAGGL